MSGIDASEVDEGVLGELPEAIQQQIRNQMRMAAAVRPAAAKRGRGRGALTSFFAKRPRR